MLFITNNMQPHIQCDDSLNVDYVLLPGDPERLNRVAKYLDEVEEVVYNREYRTLVGVYEGVKLAVTSTGIGGPSMAIAIEELKNIGVQHFIRIGSAGALDSNINLGEMLIPYGAVRNDGTGDMYVEKSFPAVAHPDIFSALVEAAQKNTFEYHQGISRSHDSFYIDNEEEVNNYWSNKGLIGADMETAPLFVIANLRGVKAGSVLNVVNGFQGDLDESINEYVNLSEVTSEGEKRIIKTALSAIKIIDNKK